MWCLDIFSFSKLRPSDLPPAGSSGKDNRKGCAKISVLKVKFSTGRRKQTKYRFWTGARRIVRVGAERPGHAPLLQRGKIRGTHVRLVYFFHRFVGLLGFE